MGPIEFPKGAFRADDYIEINHRTATQANFDALRQEGKVILLNSPAPEDVALATKLFQDSVRRSPMQ